MQRRFAEFTHDSFPRKDRNIFNGRIAFAKLSHVNIQVLMVNQFYKLIIHRSFEIADMKAVLICWRFYRNFNNIVMARPTARRR